MKKIIFIGGTSRSGSTLLDQVLSNDPKAMSLGEIYALFHPTRKHHFEELDNLSNDPVWSIIIKEGKKNLYPNLIKYFPDIDIFVDSSKDPFWFAYHKKVKKSDSYSIKNILIYKLPVELAKSFIKRGNKNWARTYIHYHKKYFSIIRNFITISYKDLILYENALDLLCQELGIKYFPDKKKYWLKEHNTFFGSNSVRSVKALDATKQLKNQDRKDLSYDAPNEKICKISDEEIKKTPSINDIYSMLEKKGIKTHTDSTSITKKCKYSRFLINLIILKSKIIRLYRYYFPKDLFAAERGKYK